MTMDNLTIRAVTKADLPLLDRALRALSSDLGDHHPADIALLEKAGFGPVPTYHALIALDDKGALFGAVVYSPFLSTSLAATGLYVSDLWVSDTARGAGLGPRLLAHAARSAEALWGAAYLKLAVYHDAQDARRFYDRMGFSARDGETTMFLDKSGFDTLKGQP